MKPQTYEQIKDRFGTIASWALWDGERFSDSSDIEGYIDERVDELKPSIILCGLNRNSMDGRHDHRVWHNFHVKGKDGWVLDVFATGETRGAYMTDVLKSTGAAKRADIKDIDLEHEFDLLSEELSILGERNYRIIAFGADAYTWLRGFKWAINSNKCKFGYTVDKLVHCTHYSAHVQKDLWYRTARKCVADIVK